MGRYVISDVHGCVNTFKKLVDEKIQLKKDDELYLLGDYIDRNPGGSLVIDYILWLKDAGFKVFPLRGNHEQQILDASVQYTPEQFRYFVEKVNKSKGLLDENDKIISKYDDFFKSLPLLIELNDFILVHAGLDFTKKDPFGDRDSILNFRANKATREQLNGKTLIFGHQPVYLSEIANAVNKRHHLIPLDNGCVYTKPHKLYDYTQLGKLCCLNIDTFDLIWQENADVV